MIFYFKIGFRNIIKNSQRSLITALPIIVGMIACLLTQGFFNRSMSDLRESTIHEGIGHYRLYKTGFFEHKIDDFYSYLIDSETGIIDEIRQLPQVSSVAPRLPFNGILASESASTVVAGEAGIPSVETELGTYKSLQIGTSLDQKPSGGIIIGKGVAEKLSANVGDVLTLITNDKNGILNALDFEVTGITQTEYEELDNAAAMIPLSDCQKLLGVDDAVCNIVVFLNETAAMQQVQRPLQEILVNHDLECHTWEEEADFYRSLKLMNNAVFGIVFLLVVIVSAFAVSNTVNMSINERFREIGTIRVLGMSRLQVSLLFIAESFMLGLLACIIGIFISLLFVCIVNYIGGLPIQLSGYAEPLAIFFDLDLFTILKSTFFFLLAATAAAVFPSRKAAKVQIVTALRWI